MRRSSCKSRIFTWLGILAIVLQSFMPLWQANAATQGSGQEELGLSGICYAMAEAAEAAPDNGAPHEHDEASNHCVLCQLPSFGSPILAVPGNLHVPEYDVAVRYVPYADDNATGCVLCILPPTRAPPA